MLVLDFETTGLLEPSCLELEKQPRAIEIGIVKIKGKKIVDRFDELIYPEMEISDEITKITGITNADLKGKRTFKEALPDLIKFFKGENDLYAHNAPFDSTILMYELQRAGCERFPMPGNIICTVAEFRHEYGRYMKLVDLYRSKMGKELKQTHRAIDDAEALTEIILKCL